MQLTFAGRKMRGFLFGAILWSVSCGPGGGMGDGQTAQSGGSGGVNDSLGGASNGASGAPSGGGAVMGGVSGTAGNAGTAGGTGGTGGTGNAGAVGVGGSPAGGNSAGGSAGSSGLGGGGESGASGSSGAGGSGAGASLPPSVTSLFPAIGASGVCLDAPLTITFASAPTIGSAGTIAIYAASNTNTPVDSINLTTTAFTDTIGGQTYNLVRPVFIDGNQAVVYFHQHKLAANTKYFVNVSSGTFVNAQKAAIGTVTGSAGWTFTTRAAPAAAESMTVDRTGVGTGNFCTVQGAFDAVPANSTAARTITVAAGNYHEILYLSGKKNITVHGANRAGTLIEYADNDALNSGTAKRPLFYANGTTGLSIENLTLYNTTPQEGTQAEALRVSGDQVILRDSNFKSLQDTLLLDGRVYVVTSYVEGNVDFVWGGGVTYFDRSEIKTVGRSGAIVQARNGAGAYGYVFVDSKLTAGPGVSNQVLARIDATQFPYSHVAYINCAMTAISAKGWTITPAGTTQTGNLRFWEYGSTDANGAPLNVSGRDPAATAINATQAAAMRDKATVLGGWDPAG